MILCTTGIALLAYMDGVDPKRRSVLELWTVEGKSLIYRGYLHSVLELLNLKVFFTRATYIYLWRLEYQSFKKPIRNLTPQL